MSRRNIDERIVEMEFQNRQFEDGVRTSIQTLDKLKQSLDFDGAEKSLQNLEKSTRHFSMSGLTGAIEAVSGKFSAMEIVAITTLQRITNKALDTGEQLIKSLSIDQITTGFSKYTDKTKSVNTIMNATGETIEYVNEHLEKLNWFTDETSYNFTDMVSNIGKFTSAGVSLDDATTAMMGIATEAALSGQGINEASRAMYNFAQAIGAGQVKLMDWRSIENANMGTQEFKQTIIDTAVAMGKLKKDTSGTIKTVKGNNVTFKNFNETLSENWFTSEVLIESLRKYGAYAEEVYKVATRDGITAAEAMEKMGDAGMELGAKAFKAAQVARTFTDAIEATKDAISSGWMRSFELIFGDVNESAELWTDATNALWEVFAAGAESRNEVLKAWHDAAEGGRADMLEGVYDAFEALWNIITSVKEALAEIFPVDWGEKLKDFSSSIRDFGNNLKKTFGIEDVVVGQKTVDVIESLPNKVEAFDKALQKGARGEGVKQMQERLKNLGYDLGSSGVDGIFGPKTEAALKAFEEASGKTMDGIYDKADHMEIMKAIFGTHEEVVGQEFVDVIEQKAAPALDTLKTVAKGVFNVVKVIADLDRVAYSSLFRIIEMFRPFNSAVGKLVGTLGKLSMQWLSSVDASKLFEKIFGKLEKIIKPVADWFNKAGKSISDFFGLDKDYKTFSEFWSNVKKNLLDPKYENVAKVWNGIKNTFDRVKNSILDFILVTDKEGNRLGFFESMKTRFSALKPIIERFSASIKSFLGIGGEGSLGGTMSVFDRINALFNKIKETWDNIREKLESSGTLDRLSSAFERVKEKFVSVWPQIKESITSIKTTIFGDNYEGFMDWFTSNLPNWVDSFASWLADIVEKLSPYIEKIPGLIDKIKEIWSTIIEKIASFFGFENEVRESLGSGTLLESIPGKKSAGAKKSAGPKPSDVERRLSTSKKTLDTYANGMGMWQRALENLKEVVFGVLRIWSVLKLSYSFREISTIPATLSSAADSIVARLTGTTKQDKLQKMASLIKSIGLSFLMIGASIALVAGSIYALGNMDQAALKQGAIVAGVIAGAITTIIAVFGLLAAKNIMNANAISGVGKSFLALAGSIAILAFAMWLIGNADQNKMQAGFDYIATIMLALGALVVAVNQMNANQLNLKGLVQLSIAIGLIAYITWLVGDQNPSRMKRGLKIVGIIAAILAAFVVVANLGKRIGKSGDTKLKGVIGIALAIGIVALAVAGLGNLGEKTLKQGLAAVGIIALCLAGLALAFSFATKNFDTKESLAFIFELLALIGVFGYVVDQIRDVDPLVMISFAGSLSAMIIALTAAVIAANKLGGGVGRMASGAAGIGAAFAIIAAIATAVVAGLGLIDDWTNGGLLNTIERGGDVLTSLIDALTPFEDYLADGLLVAGMILASAGAGTLNKFGISVAGGSADVGAAFAIITGIVTAVVAGLGALDSIPGIEGSLTGTITKGGEVLRALGSSLAQFGSGFAEVINKDIKDFADSIAEVRSAIDRMGYDGESEDGGQLGKDLSAAFLFVTRIQTFFANLAPYDTNVTYPELGTYTSAANQLSLDMDLFAKALGTLRTSLTGLSDGMLTDADIQLSIDISSKMHDFFEGIKPYDVQPLSGGGYLTAPGQLSTDMTNFGEAMGVFKDNIGRLALDYPMLLVSTKLAVSAASQVFIFFTDLTSEYEKAGAKNISYSQFREKVVTAATDELTSLSTAMAGYRTQLAGLAESSIEADSTKALEVIGQVASFMNDANKLAIPLNQSPFQKIFSTRNKAESLFEDLGALGESMRKAKTDIATLGSEGSTFDADFASAIRALTAMAEFLDGVSGLNIEENRSALQEFFIGKTGTETVFDSVGILGDKMKAVGGKIAGLGDGAFEKDFASAMRALNATATFLNRVGELSNTGYLASAGANFENVLFPIENLGEAIGDLAKNAINVDLEKFSSTVESIMGGYTKVAESMSQFAQFASGSTIQTALNDSIAAFENAGTEMTDGLASNLDEDTVTRAVINLMSAMVDAAGLRIKSFETVGTNCALGLAAGISAGTRFVVNAAESVMKRAISAAKAIADQNSPSKVFAEIGMNNDLGLALGMREYGYVVQAASEDVAQDAIDATGSMISRLSSLVTEDMDTTPTIRPVLDLSDVSNGVSTMNGLFGYSQRYTPSMSYNMAQSAASYGASGRIAAAKGISGVDIVDGIRTEIRELRSAIENMQLVTDTDALVGGIGYKMDAYLGKQTEFAKRR